jgi:putative membrane protein
MKVAAALTVLSLAVASTAYADPSSADKSFMKKAAEAGTFEVQAGQLASQTSQNPDVKAFADKMVTDHTKVGGDLSTLASSKGVTLPTDPSLTQKAKLKILSKETGSHFDSTYAKDEAVAAHKDTIALFEKEANKGTDPDVKAFAQNTLPALRGHLQMAQDLQSKTAGK